MLAKTQLVLIILLMTLTCAFAQLDPDFLKYRKTGDDCYLKKDYACAEKNYGLAIKIRVNDSYCIQQIQNCKKSRLVEEEANKGKKRTNSKPTGSSRKPAIEIKLLPKEQGGEYGFVNEKGIVIISYTYQYAGGFREGLSVVQKDYKLGFIDKTGKIVIAIEYEGASDFSEGFATVMKNKKWGFVKKNGVVAIPLVYDFAYSFSEGLAEVEKNGKWGFIDKKGKVVIPIQYDNVESFKEGYCKVKQGEREFFIDKHGKLILVH